MEETERDDPHDDSTNWIGNLPKAGADSTECPAKRAARWPQQSDVQRKEPWLEAQEQA